MNQRHILVAISGGIAAYKGAELVRLLKKQGALVRVVLSRGATEFITPLTMQALSGEPTHTELLDEDYVADVVDAVDDGVLLEGEEELGGGLGVLGDVEGDDRLVRPAGR